MIDLYTGNPQEKKSIRNKLTSREVYYLRLVLHGCRPVEICRFFNFEEEAGYSLEKKIKGKLNCKTVTSAIIKAFEINILDKYDFVDQLIKDRAVIYTDLISCKIEELTEENENERVNVLGMTVLEFYKECEIELQKKCKVVFELEEKNYLELKYINTQAGYIAEKLNLSINEINVLEKNILQKLETCEWFIGIRKVFEYGVLSRQHYISLDIHKEALECVSRILMFQQFNNLSKIEKKFAIYRLIITFYNTIEYDCLLKLKTQ